MKQQNLTKAEQKIVSKFVDANIELLAKTKSFIDQCIKQLSFTISKHYLEEYGNLHMDTFSNELAMSSEWFSELTSKICDTIEDFGDVYFPTTDSDEEENNN